jgi:hypothetical protein
MVPYELALLDLPIAVVSPNHPYDARLSSAQTSAIFSTVSFGVARLHALKASGLRSSCVPPTV